MMGALAHRDGNLYAGVGDGEVGEIEIGVNDAGCAVFAELLGVVAAAIEQADGDKGDAEVGCGFEMIAGEDAEAAGVLRQRFVDGELGAEVGDFQVARFLREVFREPRRRGEIFAERFLALRQAAQKSFVFRDRIAPLGGQHPQCLHRILIRRGEEPRIHRREKIHCVGMPAPPEILRETREAVKRFSLWRCFFLRDRRRARCCRHNFLSAKTVTLSGTPRRIWLGNGSQILRRVRLRMTLP